MFAIPSILADAATVQALTGRVERVVHRLINSLAGVKDENALSGPEELIVKALASLAVVVAVYFVARYVARAVAAPIRARVDETLGRFVNKLIFYSSMVSGGVFILGIFGWQVASLASVLAAVSFAVGLAFQGTLSSFAAGVLLLVFRPFKVGDMVITAGVTGKVYEIDLFTTVIDTPDNRRIIVPNSSIAGNTIENVTYHQYKRIEVAISVDYNANLDATRAALNDALRAIEPFLVHEPDRPHQVLLNQLSPTSIDWLVRAWVRGKEFILSRDKLIYAIKTQLDAAGINKPCPQMQIHLGDNDTIAMPGDPSDSQAINRLRPRLRTTVDRKAA